MSEKLIVSSSPHVGSPLTTKRIMLFVIIALMPSLIAGTVLYGFYALFIVMLAVGSAVGAEALYNLIAKKPQTLTDLSAIVTGLILGLNLPPTIDWYVPIIGSIFAIMVVKMLFGGLGKNFANPAATARVFLLLAWSGRMAAYIEPLNYASGNALTFFSGFIRSDIVTSATPLASIKAGAASGALSDSINLLDLFLGRTGGSIGETCVIAILIGGIFLIVTKIIDWRIPLTYIVGCAVFALIFYKSGWLYILPTLLSGGLMFAAFFMLTDYSSSPNSRWGILIYAVGAAFFTMLIRRFASGNEGVSLAILMMNCLTPLIDKATKPKPFGYQKPKKAKKEVNA